MNRYLTIFSIVTLIFANFVNSEECQHAECIFEANRIKSCIDDTLDPCDDFMEFACANTGIFGRAISGFSVKQEEYRPTILVQHYHKLNKRIIEELNQPVRLEQHRAIGLAKTYWQGCKITRPEEAAQGLRMVFNRLGQWPMAAVNWHGDFSWTNFSMNARKLGFVPKMFVDIGLNLNDVDKIWNETDTLTLTVERARFHTDNSTHEITGMKKANTYWEILVIMYGNRTELFNERQVKIELQAVHDFRLAIHNITHAQTPPILELKQVPIAELQKTYPYINWMEYLRSMLPRRQANYLSDRNCVIIEPCYLSQINDLLTRTDKAVLANHAFISLLDEMMRDIRPLVQLALARTKTQIEEICYKSVEMTFGRALDMIVAQFAGPVTKAKVTEIQSHIAHEAHQIFHRIPWMDHLTQLHAAKKSERTTFINAYPDDIFDTNHYDRLVFTKPNAILVLFRELGIFIADQYYLQVGKPRPMYALRRLNNEMMQAMLWSPFAARDVIIKPERMTNEVYIPAGTLGPGRFSTLSELDFMNYGVIGMQIAFAMGLHIFEMGSFIDSNLQWREKTWWTQMTQRHWCSRKPCAVVGSLKPLDSLEITFGYIGAAEIAYKTFYYSRQQRMCNITLPDLKYTNRQLFWISAATANCDIFMKSRVNKMLMNNCNFAVDFGCRVGSKMNLADKCKMWIP